MRQDDDAALASGTTSDGWFTRLRRSLLARLGNTRLVLGTLFFAASLTPSLTPRITVAQAVLSGMCLAAGYGLGVLLRWLWGYLELPLPGRRDSRVAAVSRSSPARSSPRSRFGAASIGKTSSAN